MVQTIGMTPWGKSTDLLKQFKLIATFCAENDVPEEDLPEALVILSDMRINAADDGDWKDIRKRAQEFFQEKGYSTVPQLIFWNLKNGTSKTQIVPSDMEGAIMMEGFSQNQIKPFLTGEIEEKVVRDDGERADQVSSYEALQAIVANEHYDAFREKVDELAENPWTPERIEEEAAAFDRQKSDADRVYASYFAVEKKMKRDKLRAASRARRRAEKAAKRVAQGKVAVACVAGDDAAAAAADDDPAGEPFRNAMDNGFSYHGAMY